MFVLKRPHVDEFLAAMSKLFECVLFTASLSKVFTVFFGQSEALAYVFCGFSEMLF